MNEVISIAGNNALVLDTTEAQETLGKEASLIEQRAAGMEVVNEASFAVAGELAKQVKGMQKKVKEYWEPLRVSAKRAYDNVLAKKKQMMDPLEGAEAILKRKMGDFTREQQRKARELEEQLRREAQAEMERKLTEAAAAEGSGDQAAADFAMAEAEVYEAYAATVSAPVQKPKATGISTQKTWKIKSIDSGKVPISCNGVELRPVDTAAVLRLIKSCKGEVSIPGVVFEEDVTVSVRS